MEPVSMLSVYYSHKLQQRHRSGGHLSTQQQLWSDQAGKNSGMGERVRSVSNAHPTEL